MRRLLIALLALPLLVACGGDDVDGDAAAPTEEAAAPATDAEPTDAGDPAATEPMIDPTPADDGDAPPAAGDDGDDAAAGGGGNGGDAAGGGDRDEGERELAPEDQTGLIGVVGNEPVTGGSPTDGVAQLVDVRVGEHEGFDRVVFEFAGAGVPEYRVAFTDPPITAAGSGQEVDVEGSAYLEVRMSGASGVDLSGDQAVETYTGPEVVDGDSTGTVTEVVQAGDFEAQLSWVIGLQQEMPFAVSTLSDPARLVVDVEVL